ncbi:MAG TPA: hypothetical protein DEQ30_04875 [Porphyromonadaceae bacterium]|nr:hypothetical protein [Porphyromonadaceae bacterium]
MQRNKEKQTTCNTQKGVKVGTGYASEACRKVGVSRTVFETAKKKRKEGGALTKMEIEVLLVYDELINEANRKIELLTQKND